MCTHDTSIQHGARGSSQGNNNNNNNNKTQEIHSGKEIKLS